MSRLFKSNPEVLVVGAGPVGLYAALNLARRGVKVEIIDEEWRGTTHSYALALHPNSLELLDELGLAETVLETARRLHTVSFYEGPERRAALQLSKLESNFPFVAILSQSDIEQLLVDALKEEGVKVQYNQRLARIEQNDRAVNATIHKLGKDSVGYAVAQTETIVEASDNVQVPLVLAADGHDSLARKQSRIKFDAVRPPQHFAVFELTASGQLPDDLCVVLEPNTTNVLWPMREHRYRWSFSLDDVVAPWDSRDKDRLLVDIGRYRFPHLEREYMDQLMATRAPWFTGNVEKVHWRIEVRFEHRLASAFGAGRVWLAGDAAHMTGPAGIQSMNVGLREASQLCEAFAGILSGSESEAALARYNTERLSEWNLLLGTRGAPKADADAPPWAAAHVERLISCIPASGDHLTALLGQLGLHPA